jgi:hypothetical protein
MIEEGRKVNIRSQSKFKSSNSDSIIKKRQINKRLKEISIDSNFLLMKDLNINNMYIDNEISTKAYEMFVGRKNKELSQIIDFTNNKIVNKDNKENKKLIISEEIISYQKLLSLLLVICKQLKFCDELIVESFGIQFAMFLEHGNR